MLSENILRLFKTMPQNGFMRQVAYIIQKNFPFVNRKNYTCFVFLLSLRRKKIARENGTNAERPVPEVYTPFVKDFAFLCRICVYSHGFAGFCRRFIFRAVHNVYFILYNRQVSCLKGYVSGRHIESNFRFGQVHTRGVKSRNFPLVKILIVIGSICRYGNFRLLGCRKLSRTGKTNRT